MAKSDDRVTKRRVTMREYVAVPGPLTDDGEPGEPEIHVREAVDYVRPDFLDAYVAKAEESWQQVIVSEEPDAGPGGYEGQTVVPANLQHELAGQVFEAEGSGGGGGAGKASSFLPGLMGMLLMLMVVARTAGLYRGMLLLVQTTAMKNLLSDAYKAAATHGAVYTTVPSSTQGTEPSGGSPAYARKPLSWGSSTNGVVSASATFDIPSGTTVAGAGLHSAITAGTYYDGSSVTSQAFASQGTYTVTFTYTQT